jgi:hypothetical protein
VFLDLEVKNETYVLGGTLPVYHMGAESITPAGLCLFLELKVRWKKGATSHRYITIRI